MKLLNYIKRKIDFIIIPIALIGSIYCTYKSFVAHGVGYYPYYIADMGFLFVLFIFGAKY